MAPDGMGSWACVVEGADRSAKWLQVIRQLMACCLIVTMAPPSSESIIQVLEQSTFWTAECDRKDQGV